MSSITTSVGLISGLDTGAIIDALIEAESGSVNRLESRKTNYETQQGALQSLESILLTMVTSVNSLNNASTFSTETASTNPNASISVSTTNSTVTGDYSFQSVRLAKSHAALSRGFADTDTQLVGEGTLVFGRGGNLDREVLLSELNGGSGVQQGSIRITDRAGNAADIDLSGAYSVNDVVSAINDSSGILITASTSGGSLVLTDGSGGGGSISVVDLAGGSAAADLGIAGSIAGDTLTGSEVYTVTGNFALTQLNDGNSIHTASGDDLRITARDGTNIDIDLSSAVTVQDVIDAINDDTDNEGKVTASLSNGRLILTDNTGESGTLSTSDLGNAEVVRQLGIDNTASGNTITGDKLIAGIDSVLLKNLNAGDGVTAGVISLTDRAGNVASVDLSSAESLDEVLAAINSAETAGMVKLNLVAELDAAGTGIVIRDTSGSTSSNLIISDTSGTLAADLGITIDAAETEVSSGNLNHRYINKSTSLSTYAPDGGAVAAGSFKITNSAGAEATIVISSTDDTIGEVIDRINAAGIDVTAELNETGDGFQLVDNSGGDGDLIVEDLNGGTTSFDLRIEGTGTEVNGKPTLVSRNAVVIEIDAEDTLDDLVTKINTNASDFSASILDDGSPFSPKRLSIASKRTGADSRLYIDDGGLNLGFAATTEGRDALLRVGGSTGPLVRSSDNVFNNVVGGLDITLLDESTTTDSVSVTIDSTPIKAALSQIVASYNGYIDGATDLTRFDTTNNTRGVLSGNSTVLRVTTRLNSLFVNTFGSSTDTIRTLSSLGLNVGVNGKLSFDETTFDDLYAEDPEGVEEFFRDTTNGFAKLADDTLDALTDQFTGVFKINNDSLASNIESLTARIDTLNARLELRRDRLILQFAAMEESLSIISSQQQALTTLSSMQYLSANGSGG
ncbi:flagellar filament capping protein FliD [Calycomorphotria hydatis]|uniref:Filament cap protein n=1 Tax=Calycomorphotria hydatis TaxID=2528027 RepID=A0A517TDW0_9PLAN|nr:flagellar filament capping protein FliD [Calycomorphotria hydatis]QDT66557.1 Flagellar hook-associated protein 2 [Calycomorphotria hydatis]